MTSNLYFAYSIRRDYNGLAWLLPVVLPPIHPKKKKTRACDACLVRKTRCDETRPCRHCVNNDLECTERRQRKKSGPKNLRKKTIDSIQSIAKDSNSQSPEVADLVASSDSGPVASGLVDTNALVSIVSGLLPDVLQALAQFSLESFANSTVQSLLGLSESIAAGSSLALVSQRLATLTYVSVVLAVAKSTQLDGSLENAWTQLQSHVSAAHAECMRLLLFQLSSHEPSSDAHYYLCLAELHMYANSKLSSSVASRELLHLHSASAHFQLLQCHHGTDQVMLRNLARTRYVWERHAFLFSPEPAFRNPGAMLRIVDFDVNHYPHRTVVDVYRSMLLCLEKLSLFQLSIPEQYTWRYIAEPTGMASSYAAAKQSLHDCVANVDVGDTSLVSVARLLEFMLSLKAIQVYLKDMSQEQVAAELLELIRRVNEVVGPTGPDLRVYFETLAVVPQILEGIRCYLHITAGEKLAPGVIDSLLQISSCVSFYMNHNFEIKDPILNEWFSRLIGPQNTLFLDILDQ